MTSKLRRRIHAGVVMLMVCALAIDSASACRLLAGRRGRSGFPSPCGCNELGCGPCALPPLSPEPDGGQAPALPSPSDRPAGPSSASSDPIPPAQLIDIAPLHPLAIPEAAPAPHVPPPTDPVLAPATDEAFAAPAAEAGPLLPAEAGRPKLDNPPPVEPAPIAPRAPSAPVPAPPPQDDDPFAPVQPKPPSAPKPSEPAAADDDDPFAPVPPRASGASRLPMRLWIDDTGLFRVEARLILILDGKVRLLKETGRTTTVPFYRLSSADRQYVARIIARYGADLSEMEQMAAR